jgi:large conductance mechanosensitive channel
VNGFIKFVVRGNIVALAVGVVIGAAFSGVVTAFVAAFLTPLVGVATSVTGNFGNAAFHVGKTAFPYGAFLNAFIAFLFTASAIYFVVVIPVNKITEELNPYHDLSKAKRSCPECLSQIPAEAKRCSFCASAVEPILDETSDKLIEAVPGEIPLSGGPSISLKTE